MADDSYHHHPDDEQLVLGDQALSELATLRKITMWVDVAGNATTGAVEWYVASQHVETVVCPLGPFETAEESLRLLLEQRRLR